jgi:hypothetical protein
VVKKRGKKRNKNPKSLRLIIVISFIIAIVINFNEELFWIFFIKSLIFGLIFIGIFALINESIRGIREKNTEKAILFGFLSIVIIIASLLMYVSSSGICVDSNIAYFTENIITGKCIFVETPHCYPWYYKSGCDSMEKKVEAAKKTIWYNETIIQCNSICAINNAKKYCNIYAFPGVSCNDLVKCASISC